MACGCSAKRILEARYGRWRQDTSPRSLPDFSRDVSPLCKAGPVAARQEGPDYLYSIWPHARHYNGNTGDLHDVGKERVQSSKGARVQHQRSTLMQADWAVERYEMRS